MLDLPDGPDLSIRLCLNLDVSQLSYTNLHFGVYQISPVTSVVSWLLDIIWHNHA